MFENDKSVRALLHACSQDPFHPEDNREYYFKMSSRRMRCKDVSTSWGGGVLMYAELFKMWTDLLDDALIFHCLLSSQNIRKHSLQLSSQWIPRM